MIDYLRGSGYYAILTAKCQNCGKTIEKRKLDGTGNIWTHGLHEAPHCTNPTTEEKNYA